MTKKEIIQKAIAANDSTIKNVEKEKAITIFLEELEKAILQDEVSLGFGIFKQGERAARTGRNPQTGEVIEIPACKTIKFKASSALKKELNDK